MNIRMAFYYYWVKENSLFLQRLQNDYTQYHRTYFTRKLYQEKRMNINIFFVELEKGNIIVQ